MESNHVCFPLSSPTGKSEEASVCSVHSGEPVVALRHYTCAQVSRNATKLQKFNHRRDYDDRWCSVLNTLRLPLASSKSQVGGGSE